MSNNSISQSQEIESIIIEASTVTESPSIKEKNILSNYLVQKTIGEGTFGKVKLAIHIPTGENVAIKVLDKEKIEDEEELMRITREIKYLKYLHHQNVIKIYEILENEKIFYIIMEYATKGELFTYITERRRLDENEACFFFAQIITGIEYIHINRIAHRDLKPENILISNGNILKIIDFGLSNKYQVGELLSTACGSPCYASPEMILGQKYKGVLTDIWSSGVVLYAMVCGFLPFEDENNEKIYQKILSGLFEIPNYLSPGCKDLLKKLLTINPNKRIKINEIKIHLFLQEGFQKYNNLLKESSFDLTSQINDEIIDKMILMPSYLLNDNKNNNSDEEGIQKIQPKRIVDTIDKEGLIKLITKGENINLKVTFNLLLNQYCTNSSKIFSNISTNNRIFSNKFSENTSKNTPYNCNNESKSMSKESPDKSQISQDKQVNCNEDSKSELKERESKELNTIHVINVNEEIIDSISTKVISHSFKNSFKASKRQKSDSSRYENFRPNTVKYTITNINNGDQPCNMKNTEIMDSSSNHFENPHHDDRAVSLDVSKIVKKNQMDSNVILGKIALDPLYKSKNKNKFKRHNIINAYLQSSSLSNKITNIHHLIDNSTSIDEAKNFVNRLNKKNKLKSSTAAPSDSTNINDPKTKSGENTNQLNCKVKRTLSFKTGGKKMKTIEKDSNNKQTNTPNKRAKSARINEDLNFINNLNCEKAKEKKKKEKDNEKAKIEVKHNKNEVKKPKSKEIQLIEQFQPCINKKVKYNAFINKKIAHFSILENGQCENIETQFNDQKKKAKQSSIEFNKCKNSSKCKKNSSQLYIATEGLKENYKIEFNKNLHYRNIHNKSPQAILNDKSLGKTNIFDERNAISPVSFHQTKQLYTTHYNTPNVVEINIKTNENCKYDREVFHSTMTNKNNKPNICQGQSKKISNQTIIQPTKHNGLISPIPLKTKHNNVLSKQKASAPLLSDSNLKNKSKTFKPPKSVQLQMMATNNDFALCSTKSSLLEIKEKLHSLTKENNYILKEIEPKQFICHKNTDSTISIEVSRVESKNVIKLYHSKGNESETKEMIKKIIIDIGF